MDNIRTSIEILFKKQNPEKILDKYYNSLNEDKLDRDLFTSTYSYEKPNFYNKDEIQNVYDILDSEWKKLEKTKIDSIFNVLVNFTKDILKEDKGIPVCRYKYFLKWRELSYLLGEDLLTTAHFAYDDFIRNYKRTIFAWKPIISTDNIRLKEILKKGLAENHFHLKGSSPHYNLAWISLMNNIKNRDSDFMKLEKEKKLSPEVNYDFNTVNLELKALIKKASAIRLFLYEEVLLNSEKLEMNEDELINKILKSKSNSEIKLYISDLQKNINLHKYLNGKRFDDEIADYLIPKNISSNNYYDEDESYNGNILLYGERYFLYTYLNKFYKGDEKAIKYKRLFHAYIIIKEKFRDELIQINNRTGFGNFADYQNRKAIFLGKEIYKNAVLNMAINSSMKDQHIKSLEARIGPEDNYFQLNKEVKNIDNSIADKRYFDIRDYTLENFEKKINNTNSEEKSFFYAVHFIKFQDSYSEYVKEDALKSPIRPRNYKVRKDLKQKANAIINLRNSNLNAKNRILGIDAANFEIGCRPEVFSQCFRYLRKYKSENKLENLGKEELFNLGITYHAGEDFLSIIDGLRAIDETVRFLEYEQGDRLGHALALGVDPYQYFMEKNYILILPKQVHLDNVVWLMAKCREFNINLEESVKAILMENYYRLFSYIYNDIIDFECSPEIYYMSWKLRGDNPKNYIEGRYQKMASLDFWEKCSVSNDKALDELRKNPRIVKLYATYHFNKDVKVRGMESEEIKIDKRFFKIIKDLQIKLQKDLAKRNICIETNPSSNYVIGTFKRYDEHPISKFYNLGLTYDTEKVNDCPQLSVSINTDDQGVFATYLENEYALIALAMEKATNDDGELLFNQAMIYDWIDRIREMGLEQSFKRRN